MGYLLSTRDMLLTAKRKWKQILLIAVICALVAGGFHEFMTIRGGEASAEDIEQSEKAAEVFDAWTDARHTTADTVSEDLLRAYDKVNESPVMKIDAMDCSYRVLVFALGEPDVNRTDTVKGWITEAFTDPQTGEERYITDVRGSIGEVSVIVWDNGEYDLEQAAKEIENQVLQKAENTGIPMKMVSNVQAAGMSQALFEKQDILRYDVIRLQNELANYNADTAMRAPTHISSVDGSSQGLLKHIFLGFLVGLFVGLIVVIGRAILKGVLLSREQINGSFGIKELGAYSSGDQNSAALLSATIAAVMDKEKARLLVFDDADAGLCEQMAKELNQLDAQEFVCGSGLTEDMASAKSLIDFDGAIASIRLEKTTYRDVQKMISWTNRFGKTLVGYIVIN